MSSRVVVLAGDGVGPEVTAAAMRVLEHVSVRHALKLEFENALVGGAAYDAAGSPLPDATVAACKASKGILLGAVGGPKWAYIPVQHRPEQGLLAIRKALGLFANLRPVTTMPELAAASPLKPEKLKGVDILVIRELTGGIYFGKRSRSADSVFDTCEYTAAEIERVCRVAGELAMKRRRKITSVDITTLPYPGFPTDLQAQFMALMAKAKGVSVITEKVYPERFIHASELVRLGALIRREGPSAIIEGTDHLTGAPVMASDLRASAGLVVAGLMARGQTDVRRVYHIDRGYERIEQKLQLLGADIERISEG